MWSGVLQGSVLGRVLFLLFVNDLLDNLQSSGKLFADDAKIYRSIRSSDDCSFLQKDLDSLQVWSKTWLLNFNKEKCEVMHFGGKTLNYAYTRETTLATTKKEKDL